LNFRKIIEKKKGCTIDFLEKKQKKKENLGEIRNNLLVL
jgi:hypothetical protein